MVADVRGIVAGGAGAVDQPDTERIVQARHAGDLEWMRVEDQLAAGYGLARLRVAARAAEARPATEQRERVGVERRASRVVTQRVVDAWEVAHPRECGRPTGAALSVE